MSNAIVLTIFLCAPIIWSVVAFTRPLTAIPDGSRFGGRYRGWKLTHVTGVVLASSTHTRTYGGGSVSGSVSSGVVTGTAHVTTDVHENMRLRLADGRQADAEVVNYSVTAQPGDVLSVWNVHRRSKRFTVAVLNHTTRHQSVNSQDIFRILQPHQIPFVIWVCFLAIPIAVLSAFGGAGVPLLIFIALLVLYYLGQKHVISGFRRSGIGPIWQQSTSEASAFIAQ